MPRKSKELKLPTSLLDRIQGDSFDNKEWQASHNINRKRKSRKDSRKEIRQSKKQKVRGNHTSPIEQPEQAKQKVRAEDKKPAKKEAKPKGQAKKSDRVLRPFASAHEEELRRKDEEDVKYYAKKLGQKSLKLKSENDGLDDILGDLDFDNFSENEDGDIESPSEDGEESDDNRIDGEDVYSDEDDEDENGFGEDEPMTAKETLAKLAALKKGKPQTKKDEYRVIKEDDLEKDDSFDEFSDDESGSNDEEEMTADETMAKLAALKARNSANDRVEQIDASNLAVDDDSLSEGDFDDESEGDFSESEENGETMSAEETMAKLAALKAGKRGNTPKGQTGAADDEIEEESDLESESSSEEEDDENPYVPPKLRRSAETATSAAAEQTQDSEAVLSMRRAFKSSLNKLTESTLPHITNEIAMTFFKNSRAEASEVLTAQLLELVDGPQPLQQTLYTVYAGLVAAVYQNIGIEFAAHFVQCVVERIVNNMSQASNLLSILVECYALHVISSRLLYDLMKKFLSSIDSPDALAPVELLLIIIRNSGSQLRSDDPVALKEVIVLLQQRMQHIGGVMQLSPRMRFLVDAIVALKNNRQKPVSELVVSLRHRIRKTLQSQIGGSKGSSSSSNAREPLQVGTDDILNSQTKGKWWLVGASWKGRESSTAVGADEDKIDIDLDDEFGSSTPDWLELAKKQRLNTDVRRAIFVALMGAEDYLDACMRIDKLGLKNKQERDIPHVILHCLVQEPYYNPYYALVAGKQCTRHSTMKTFQFRLWDWFNTEPSGNPQQAMHYGRFYAALVSQKVMSLDLLKKADFLGGSSDVQIFLQFFCVTLYKEMARQAEKLAKQSTHRGFVPSAEQTDRDGKELVLLLSKVKEPTILRGLQILNKPVLKSEAIQSAKDRSRVEWAAQITTDVIDELVRRPE